MSDSYPTSEKQRDRRGVWLAIAGMATMLGGLWLAGWLFVGGSVPSGTQVADVEIGGLSPEAAAVRLDSELADRADDPIRLVWQGQRFQLDPTRAGLRFDIQATVEEAGGGRSWNPMRILDTLLGTDEVRPVIDVDEAALDRALAGIAKRVDHAPAEPRITFASNGARTVTQPRSGHQVDRQAVADDIVSAYLRSDDPVQLQIEAVQPTAGSDDVARALDTYADPAMSGPIRLQLPNRTLDLTVPEFAPALSLRVSSDGPEPSIDVARLARQTDGLRQRVDIAPRNARVVLRGGRPAIVPSKPGIRLDPAEVAVAIQPALDQRGPHRAVGVRTSVWQPRFTTEDARKLGIRRVVSSFRTFYPHAGYRNVNLGRAARLVNGTVLRPGETFSFNDTVGRTTRANGFTVGYVIDDGSVGQDVGGGVSQVATTLFNAAFFAGLEDVHHRPHTFFNDRYPVGREAMVAWPGVDLRFKNTTPSGVLIQAWTDRSAKRRAGQVHVRMWSTKHWDVSAGLSDRKSWRPPGRTYDRSRGCHAQKGKPGFDVEVYRYFRRPGTKRIDHKETMRASYLAVDRVICGEPRPRTDRTRRR